MQETRFRNQDLFGFAGNAEMGIEISDEMMFVVAKEYY